jgi:branched-chain amino acid transport system substrate-binding protein
MKTRKIKLWSIILAVQACILITAIIAGYAGPAAAAPTTDAVAVKEWQLPALATMTGPVAALGIPALQGAKYAVEEINAGGGVRGVPIKLVEYDTAMDPAKSVAAMARAIPGSLMVLGPFFSPEFTAVNQQLRDNRIPAINGNSTSFQLSASAPYSVSLTQSQITGIVMTGLEWLKLQPNIKSVAVFMDPSSPNQRLWVDGMTKGFANVGVTTLNIEMSLRQIDFGSAVIKALGAKVDGYYDFGMAAAHSAIAKELHNRGATPGAKYIALPTAYGPELFTIGKGYLENSYLWDNVNPLDTSPRYLKLDETYKKEHKGQAPTGEVAEWYDAVYAFKTAVETLKLTGNPGNIAQERQAITDFLYNSGPLQGIQYRYRYVKGEKMAPFTLMQIKNNAITVINSNIAAP